MPEIYRKLEPSVVAVQVRGRQGTGEGSGVVYDARRIVTNHHVVAGAQDIEVALANGERISARVLASDQRTDLALLAVPRDLPAATFAEALAPVGSLAVAIGFAIPSPTVLDVVRQLEEDGQVDHAFLGVQLRPLTPAVAEQLEVGTEQGVIVAAVEQRGPADRGGLRPGDIIVQAGTRRVAAVEDVLSVLRRMDAGDSLALNVMRDGERREVRVTTGRRPG